jgi:hypothetical protein
MSLMSAGKPDIYRGFWLRYAESIYALGARGHRPERAGDLLGVQATSGSADQRCESLPETLDLATRRRRGAPEMLLCDDESTGGRFQDDDGATLNR